MEKGGEDTWKSCTAPDKKVRQVDGGAIGSATAAGSIVTSHRFFGQVLLRIFAFSGSDVILLLPHPHAAQ